MKITVTSIRSFEIQSNSLLKGFADVQIDEIVIRNFRILVDGDSFRMAFPQMVKERIDGGHRYISMLSMPNELKAEIERAVIGAWKVKNFDLTKEKENV